MPQIAEIKEDPITKDIWVRIERKLIVGQGHISLYTPEEIEHLKWDVAASIIDQIDKLFPKI